MSNGSAPRSWLDASTYTDSKSDTGGMRDAKISLVVRICEALEVDVDVFIQEMLNPCSTDMGRGTGYLGRSD